jgi:catalase
LTASTSPDRSLKVFEGFWVKYHFKTDQGIECLTPEEADRIAKGVKGG